MAQLRPPSPMKDVELDSISDDKDISLEQVSRVSTALTNEPKSSHGNPLHWPLWVKMMVLTQVSILAALGGLNTATINPALVDLGHEFGITSVHASYQTTVCIALNGVAPWIWIPLANKYGRRPVYLASLLLGFASILACAYAQSYATLIVARVFNGFFPAAFALGASTVTDLFPAHQRGRALGFFTVTMTTGSHLAPIIGGLVGGYLGWRWIFKFIAIVDATMLITSFFCCLETLTPKPSPASNINSTTMKPATEHKDPNPNPNLETETYRTAPFSKQAYVSHLTLISPHHKTLPPLQPLHFLISSLSIAWYPSIILPALYYSTQYGFASILPAVTVAPIFSKAFGWTTLHIGLTYGIALTLGGILGECFAGWIVDSLLIRAKNRRPTKQAQPEVRLHCIWPGEIIVPSALLIYGFTLAYHDRVSWVAPIFAIGLACFGLQIITTTCYTYAIDCYKDRSAEVAQVLNFVRQVIGMTFAFYAVDLGEEIGFQWLFVFYACCGGILAFLGILLVMWKGEKWRNRIADRFG